MQFENRLKSGLGHQNLIYGFGRHWFCLIERNFEKCVIGGPELTA